MRNVIVTGGSRGLGLGDRPQARRARAIASIAVARQDERSARRGDRGRRAAPIRDRSISCRSISADIAGDPGSGQDAAQGVRADLRPRQQRGASAPTALSPSCTTRRSSSLIRLNTLSPIVLTKYVVRSMMADGGGRIVNVASIIGFTGYSGLSVYGATKASMIGFTRSLAREVGRMGVNVNAVAPGFVDTEMTQGTGRRATGADRAAQRAAPACRRRRRRRRRRVPARRQGEEHHRHRAHRRCRQYGMSGASATQAGPAAVSPAKPGCARLS